MDLALVLFLLPILVPSSHALVFHLPSGRVKCLTEELRQGAMSVGHYHIADDPPPDIHRISALVTGPNGENVHRTDSVESGEFAFVAEEEGRYTACFWSPRFELSAAISIDIEWKAGIDHKGMRWTAVAKKSNIDVMATDLKELEDSVRSIHEEMIFLRTREEEARRLIETTNSRMGLLSLLSLVVCLGVAGLQLRHLKVFFERQKLL